MFDPFSWLAIAVFGGGLISTGVKMGARSDARAAYKRMQEAYNNAKAQYNHTTQVLNDLASERQAALGWIYPIAARAIKKLGLRKSAYDPVSGIFGGRTMHQMHDLMIKLRQAIVPPMNAFDSTVALLSGSAVLIEGVQYLDGVGVIDAPIFHETLNETLAHLSGDTVDHFGHAFGHLGDIGVADLFGDALGIFSALKLGYNIFRINELSDIRADYETRAEKATQASEELQALEWRAHELRQVVREQSYEADRWTMIAEAAVEAQSRGGTRFFDEVRTKLQSALVNWWQSLEMSVCQA